MATKDITHDLKIQNGYFTGNYAQIGGTYSNLPQLQRLSNDAVTFTQELINAIKKSPTQKALPKQKAKIQNMPNSLPFTGAVSQQIGPQGLLYLGGVLRLCQYHKKTPPMARYM